MADMDRLAAALRQRVGGPVHTNAPLEPYTTFRVGGPADVLVEAEEPDDVLGVAEVVRGAVPVAVVGRGSNLLVSDAGFRGVAVRLGRGFRRHERTASGLRLGGSVFLPAAARLTARLGLTGFEFAAEIPATFGGAVRMNAGSHGRSMEDVLRTADVVDVETGEGRRVSVDELAYGYRHSELASQEVVVGGEVVLTPGEPEAIGAQIAEHLRWRREYQPTGRSAGSVFKNPPGDAAGRLIEAAGAKGLRSGGAVVSDVHANFIVAEKGASAEDVWRLIQSVRGRVEREFGIQLELEVRILGAFPQVEGV